MALRLLKANLGEYEEYAQIMEFALRQPLSEKLEPILKSSPRILGISVSIWNHKATLELLKALHKAWDESNSAKPEIILGGPEASHLPETAELFLYADWVVCGEGEEVFKELCALLLKNESVAGRLSFLPMVKKVSGKRIETKDADIKHIDSGYRLYTDEDLKRKLIYIEAGRGCPFGCAFSQSAHSDVRDFPLEVFFNDIEMLLNRGAKAFKMLDRTFNLNIERAEKIMEFFLSRIEPPCYIHFEMIPSRFPPELREMAKRFPPETLRIEMGIQTFNPRVAKTIGRRSDPERELDTLRFLKDETKAIVHADLIAGLPEENMLSFGAGFDRLWLTRPTEIQVGILKRLYGTTLFRHDNMRFSDEPPYEVLETASLSVNDLERIKNFARFWELIVNRDAFPDLAEKIFPQGKPLFFDFMELSDKLREHFGRNWGIDRKELRAFLEAYTPRN